MKAAVDITTLAQRIQAQQDAKEDFIMATSKLTFRTEVGETPADTISHLDFEVDDGDEMLPMDPSVLPLAHEQIALHTGIPKGFYERLRVGVPPKNNRGGRKADPALLDHIVNELFRLQPKQRMLRTLDGRARAFLSNRFRQLDNFDLAEAVFPVIAEMDSPLVEGEITDLRLYLKVLLPKIQATVPEVGDVVQSGFIIKNSEVGLGAFSVQPLIYTLACKNGMIVPSYSMRAYHVGRAAEELEAAYKVFRPETLEADDKAFWMKAQDVVRAAADEAAFQDIVARLGEAAATEPMEDVQVGVERLAKKHTLNETESKGILQHLAAGGNLSLYGLSSAITRTAQDVESYDRSVELEQLGGSVVLMPKQEWKALATA